MTERQALARLKRMARSLQAICDALDPLVEGEEGDSPLWEVLNACDSAAGYVGDRLKRTAAQAARPRELRPGLAEHVDLARFYVGAGIPLGQDRPTTGGSNE